MCTVNLARLVTLAQRRSLAAQHRVVHLADELGDLASQRARLARYALDYRLSAARSDTVKGSAALRSVHAMAGGLDEQLARLDETLAHKRTTLAAAREAQREERGSERALVVLLERARAKERGARLRRDVEAFDASCALRLRAEHGRNVAARRASRDDGDADASMSARVPAHSLPKTASVGAVRAPERLAA